MKSGGERARLYRRAAVGVKAVAALLIAGGGVYQFSNPAPWDGVGNGLQALFSVRFDDGRRFQISWGPETEAAPVPTPAARAEASAVQSSQPTEAAPIFSAPANAARQPSENMVRAATSEPLASRPFSACSIGDRNAGERSAVISKASMEVADVHLDAFGLTEPAGDWVGGGEKSSYILPVLTAIRSQGAVASFRGGASATTLPGARKLPNTLNGVTSEDGAFALGAAHGTLDLVEVGHGSYVDELNPWYHALNAGMRTAIVGPLKCGAIEDPQVFADPSTGPRLQFARLSERFARAASYVSDGSSSLDEFLVDGHKPDRAPGSEVKLAQPGAVSIAAKFRATLPDRSASSAPNDIGWSLESARYGSTRSVLVEVVVNGAVVAAKPIVADGSPQALALQVPIEKSSWVALRLMGAGHSNPVYVMVDNQPIQPSRSSVEWSQRALMQAYDAQNANWRPTEAPQAAAAFRYAFARLGAMLARATGP